MSEHVETANARYLIVDATAQPETMDFGNGETNPVSCVRLRDVGNQTAFVVEGRPEEVLSVFRQAVALAEENLLQTVRDPSLRRLYGMSQDGTEVRS